ncbi:P-loop containing nucleoside triphosphate hydrolase [Phialemonium atrogriseum]|uniref:P-loop containing nucleoside triphosphate hydrolase n=1 Tax=Phialemonium atrogriseum TaxID=1093897 RepID=A0AAJ0BPC4_9PEZI|nr:P-loop containing nucleoside triphosphate hydrolase [Phialemonium atrogriseum]KAK1762005.1 P-loop containing nucleoside triphosphate hydrolase [Phialemonium atrogriseum]
MESNFLTAMIEEDMLRRAIEASKAESHPKHPEHASSSGSPSENEPGHLHKRKDVDGEPETPRKKTRSRVNLLDLHSLLGSGDKSDHETEDEFSECTVQPGNIKETLEHVHVSPDVIDALSVLTLSIKDPGAFKVGILSKHTSLGVLLYGPPGTGKTLVVRALAKQANAKMLAVSGADIRSKFVGDGEKKIKRMFAYARQHSPCIIFIDEADSVFRSRSAEGNCRGHLSDLNQFLTEMDGITSKDSNSPMVIAASNRPFDIDEGVLRRLGRRILINIPDAAGREQILKIHLVGETMDPSLDLAEIAKSTQDYTGSDLRDLVWEAAIEAVREMHRRNSGLGISKASQQGGAAGGANRVLRRDHFLWAKRVVCPAPKSELVALIGDFHSRFGSAEGAGRRHDHRVEKINKTNTAMPEPASSCSGA